MGTAYCGTAEEKRALDTYIKLMRAANSMTARLSGLMKQHGLTPSQFGLLEVLYHRGPLCQRELGRKLLTSGGNVTMVVDNLEKRSLVLRHRSATDRRYISVHLTPAGADLIQEIFPLHVEAIVTHLGVLTPFEQDELGLLCRTLGLACAGREDASLAPSKARVGQEPPGSLTGRDTR